MAECSDCSSQSNLSPCERFGPLIVEQTLYPTDFCHKYVIVEGPPVKFSFCFRSEDVGLSTDGPHVSRPCSERAGLS